MMQPPRFRELCRVKISPNLDLVFSQRADGKYSVAQQIWSDVDGRRVAMWVKNALITDQRGLEEAANGFMACIEKIQDEEQANAGSNKAQTQAS